MILGDFGADQTTRSGREKSTPVPTPTAGTPRRRRGCGWTVSSQGHYRAGTSVRTYSFLPRVVAWRRGLLLEAIALCGAGNLTHWNSALRNRAEAEATRERLATAVDLSTVRVIDSPGALQDVKLSEGDGHAYAEGIRRELSCCPPK